MSRSARASWSWSSPRSPKGINGLKADRGTMQYLLLTLLVSGALFAQPTRPVDEGMTDQGPVRMTIINHASFVIELPGQVIYVDPVGANRYEGLPQPDLILITHSHGDHMDPAAVAKLKKAGTPVSYTHLTMP